MKVLNLFEGSKQLSVKKGQVIISSDVLPEGIYLIVEGFIKLYSLTEDGQEKIHLIYKKDEVFPLIWALKDLHREVFYEALTDSKIKKISRSVLLNRMKEDPELLGDINQMLTGAFNIYADRVENLEITSAYSRLIYRLISLSSRFGSETKEGLLIIAPLTHKDIANSINMSRETASREFEKLEKKRLVRYKGHQVLIPNLKNLQQELISHYERELL